MDSPSPPEIRGLLVDARGRCSHWSAPVDIVSFRFPCCEGFWACHDCHEAVADHPARPWPEGSGEEAAVLCGACGTVLSIRGYRDSPEACPSCSAAFNPRCSLHHPRYFADAHPTPPSTA